MNEINLIPPTKDNKVLLHVCCAPCAGSIIESILESGIDLTLFFYNPNIYPHDEYQKRKNEVIRYALKKEIPYIDAEYDSKTWNAKIKGLENEPERGKRCDKCFDIRLSKTALYASENNIHCFATTLGISRWKDLDKVNKTGNVSAEQFPALKFWDFNWRKKDGSQRASQIAKEENFYRQKYCGCEFSIRN